MHPAEVGLGEFPRKPRLPRKCEGIRKPLVILAQPERPGFEDTDFQNNSSFG